MIQALRDRVGLSEDDAKRTVEVVDEVLAHEQAQQPKAAPLRLGDSNPFKDAVVTERTGLSFGEVFGSGGIASAASPARPCSSRHGQPPYTFLL